MAKMFACVGDKGEFTPPQDRLITEEALDEYELGQCYILQELMATPLIKVQERIVDMLETLVYADDEEVAAEAAVEEAAETCGVDAKEEPATEAAKSPEKVEEARGKDFTEEVTEEELDIWYRKAGSNVQIQGWHVGSYEYKIKHYDLWLDSYNTTSDDDLSDEEVEKELATVSAKTYTHTK